MLDSYSIICIFWNQISWDAAQQIDQITSDLPLLLVLVNFVASIEMSTQDVKILAISQTLGKILQKQQNHLQDVALLVLQDDPIIWGSE